MKRIGVLVLLVLLVFSFSACGVPQEEYDALLLERDDLSSKNESLNELSKSLENTLEEKQAEIDRLTAEIKEMEEEVFLPQLAAPVIDIINAIGEVTLESEPAIKAAQDAYKILENKAKKYVPNYQKLTDAVSKFNALKAEEDAKPIIALIDAIGEVTLESEEAIKAATGSYNKLSSAAQQCVTNYSILSAAKDKLSELQEAEKVRIRTEEVNRTQSQINALRMAESYLEYSAFSRSGLIGQLEYEGFSTEDATYAVDHCDADWSEQAVKMAESYLEYSAFSRAGLIDQLIYEGFTREQAEYGASQNGY